MSRMKREEKHSRTSGVKSRQLGKKSKHKRNVNSRNAGSRTKRVSWRRKRRTESLSPTRLTKLMNRSKQKDKKVGAKAKRGPELVAVAIRLVVITTALLMIRSRYQGWAGKVRTVPDLL